MLPWRHHQSADAVGGRRFAARLSLWIKRSVSGCGSPSGAISLIASRHFVHASATPSGLPALEQCRAAAMHVLAQNPAAAPDLAEAYLSDPELIEESWVQEEYAALAIAWFPSLPPE